MSKENLNIDPLEQFFKDSFKEYQPEINPADMGADWSHVQNNLPAPPSSGSGLTQLTQSLTSVKSIVIVAASALIITSSIILFNKSEKSINPQEISPEKIDQVQAPSNGSDESAVTPSQDEIIDDEVVRTSEDKERPFANNPKQTPKPGQASCDSNNDHIVNQSNGMSEEVLRNVMPQVDAYFFSGDIIIEDTILCLGDSLRVIYKPSGVKDIVTLHLLGKQIPLDENGFVYRFRTTGKYLLKFVIAQEGKQIIRYRTVMVVNQPEARFDLDGVETPKFRFVDRSKCTDKKLWLFGDGSKLSATNPVHVYNDSGIYTVTLIASYRGLCYDTFAQTIHARIYPEVVPPNIITPNGDGRNDYLKISIEGEVFYELTIIDRYKRVVFSSKDKNEYWDGSDRGTGKACPQGTYYYFLNYKYAGQDQIVPLMGTITLTR